MLTLIILSNISSLLRSLFLLNFSECKVNGKVTLKEKLPTMQKGNFELFHLQLGQTCA